MVIYMNKNAFIFVSISFLCVTFFTLLPLYEEMVIREEIECEILEKKQQMIRSGKQHLQEMGGKGNPLPLEEAPESSAQRRRQQKEQEAKERRLRREKEAAEKEIARLEEELAELERQTASESVMTDPDRLREVGEAMEQCRRQLDETYER